MEHRNVIEFVILGTLSGSAALVSTLLWKMSEGIKDVTKSVQELNAAIKVITSQNNQTSDTLKDHESRIRNLERVK